VKASDPGNTLNAPLRIGLVFGTRPEVIKLYPLWSALQPYVATGKVDVSAISTGQQRELLAQGLGFFGWTPEYEFDLMRDGDELAAMHARILSSLACLYRDEHFDWIVVQGDTLTAWTAAMAAFYARIPVAHVEAGLRTWDPEHPFPEEVHRRWITACATLHFCPTEAARRNLLAEGTSPRDVLLVGNTVVDAVRLVSDRIESPAPRLSHAPRRLFLTVHRRENHSRLVKDILPAIKRVVREAPDVEVVVSVHPNPAVREPLLRQLGGLDRVQLMPPLSYGATLGLVRDSTLVVTDSGGLQEEAAVLGTPVMVLRRVTERIEAVRAGNALVIGTDVGQVAGHILEIVKDDHRLGQMARPSDVFGDGHAAERIAALLAGDGG